ncbi:MAG: hypothetical protein AAGD11_13220 [Planctomycetota bacterium]
MTQLQQKITIPDAMAQKLELVRRRTLKVRIGTAIVAGVGVLLAAMGVAMLVDWLATLYDFRWRAALTYTAWITALVTLTAWAYAAWRHTRTVETMAAKVDEEMPELEERWSTIAEVTASGKNRKPSAGQVVHPAMFQQVSEEALRWTPRVEPDRVIPLDGLIRALMFLTAITSILGIAVVLDSQRTTVLIRRFWQPFAPISATEITDLSGDLVVGRGESLEIKANLVGAPVQQASLLVKPAEGEAKTISLTPGGDTLDQLSHRLRSVKEPMRYRLRAGDGQTPWYEIAVADRPQLAAVRVTLTPPAYTRKESKTIDKLPRRVTVLEGSHVEVALKPKQTLRSLSLRFSPELSKPLFADEQGWYHWQSELTENIAFQTLLIEEHGLENLRPPTCEIRIRPDRPPVVKILTPNSEMAVRPDDTVPVTFIASDDVGVHQAELVVYDEGRKTDGKPTVLDRIPVPLGDQQGNVKVKATVKLDLSRYETNDGSELSFSVRVREDRGQVARADADLLHASDVSMEPIASEVPAVTQTEQLAAAASLQRSRSDQQPSPAESTVLQSSQGASGSTGATAKQISEGAAVTREGVAMGEATTNEKSSQNDGLTEDSTEVASETNDKQNQIGELREQTDGDDASITQGANNSDAEAETSASSTSTTEDAEGRTSTSGRLSLNTADESNGAQSTDAPGQGASQRDSQRGMQDSKEDSSADDRDNPSARELSSDTSDTDPSPDSQGSRNGSSSTAQDLPQSPASESSESPGNPMSRRELDVEGQAQSSNSQRMRLKIDQWAGSFDGQQRAKLEIAIAPKMEAIDRALEKAQELSRSVLDDVDAGKPWSSKHDRDIQRADEQVETAIKAVEELENETYGTPYAFIGLQLVDIKQAHISLARRDFWKALQTQDAVRVGSVRDGWAHTTRARELMVMLTERFERTKIEYKMAESVENIKKMYRIFVEDSMELLKPDGDDGGRYKRKVAEFDLDEEYLKRLEEVIEMRNEMRKELARILADDPRLLRRFLDAQRNQQVVLRNNLDRLIEDQDELNRETRAWAVAEEQQRPALAKILIGRHVESAQDIAIAAAALHDRFETWSPLGKEAENPDFQSTAEVLQEISTATRELSEAGLQYVADSMRAKKRDESISDSEESGAETPEQEEGAFNPDEAIERISVDAQQLYETFTRLEVLLRQVGSREERLEIASFATNRLLETRRLIEQTSAWIRQLKQQRAGNYHRAAEVAQYRLATRTDTLAGKLANLEQTMAGLLQNDSNMLPKSIADKARALLAALDEQAAPNQLASVYALRRSQLSRATSRQQSALEALELAGSLYDEMVEEAIKELDQLPVQDPIASLLDDPTLDDLLRELEREVPIEEALGIPARPSNLQIMSDWLRPGGDNDLMTGGNRRMMMEQMRRQQELRQRQLEQAYRRAVARALDEAEAEDLVKDMPKLARETSDWNRLASQLEDDLRQGRDKAPPERYRRAIEQYFRQVSGSDEANQ